MFKEFKTFISKGNVMNLAIGVIIGAAFQSIVNSLVNDIIMPFISLLTGNIDFSDMVLHIGNSTIKYGSFIASILNFLIIAIVIFLMVRSLNKMDKKNKESLAKLSSKLEKYDKTGILKKQNEKNKKESAETEPSTKLCPFCFSEIPYKATKCPNCTSNLKVESIIKEANAKNV